MFGSLEKPEDGVNIHGLFIDAGRWDVAHNCLSDALPGTVYYRYTHVQCTYYILYYTILYICVGIYMS